VNRAALEGSAWAERFRRTAPSCYEEALEVILHPGFQVVVKQTGELEQWCWAITIEGSELWLDSFDTEAQACALCELMGWTIEAVHRVERSGPCWPAESRPPCYDPGQGSSPAVRAS
jgi:hypothetical protein